MRAKAKRGFPFNTARQFANVSRRVANRPTSPDAGSGISIFAAVTIDGHTIRLRFDDGTDETPPLSIKGKEIKGMLSGTMITFRRVSGSS